jgi:hypothetical protein
MYGIPQSGPSQSFVSFELKHVYEISLEYSHNGGFDQVLQRPIETIGVIGRWELGQTDSTLPALTEGDIFTSASARQSLPFLACLRFPL